MNSTEKGNIGEDFVNQIAYNSFVKYWCYPSPKDEHGDKKEICDLLVIFGDSVIIISVKNYEFKDNYVRYFRSTLDKAVKQIYGAERKLFKSENEIYIKHPNKIEERFPKERIKNIYRVIVNLGEGVKFHPFNDSTKDDKYISIFDKAAFESILTELDTIPDFIEYIHKREAVFDRKNVTILPGKENDFHENTSTQFFEHGKANFISENKQGILLSGTEQDLLAHFLNHNRNFSTAFTDEKYNGMLIQIDGEWEEYKNKESFLQKKQEDKYSYLIDELVKREILTNMRPNSESLATALLSFNRFYRRIIAKNFIEFCETYNEIKGTKLARRYADFNGTGIVFAFYSPEMRTEMVNALLELTVNSFILYSNYKSKTMILIATTFNMSQFKMTIIEDVKKFTTEKELEIKEDVKSLGWFTKIENINYTESEYPK